MPAIKRFRITLTKGMMGKSESQRRTLEALGLRRRLQSVVVEDNPAMRGQILKIQHLVTVEVLK